MEVEVVREGYQKFKGVYFATEHRLSLDVMIRDKGFRKFRTQCVKLKGPLT
ncbi:11794_t:CDS:2 [Diversispora eburnea]|uniref:11794_t:CDS:1 n=2 Tax=Diversisporales TaxID=214509 RepID=A0A9N8VG01_9GLOM|nr:11794_t:CDS:2 [Diversispora eburnea]CAG8455953.1 13528_t:CDS:2 [Dentiscutata erythropus]